MGTQWAIVWINSSGMHFFGSPQMHNSFCVSVVSLNEATVCWQMADRIAKCCQGKISRRKLTTSTQHLLWLTCPLVKNFNIMVFIMAVVHYLTTVMKPNYAKNFAYMVYFDWNSNRNSHYSIIIIHKPLNHSQKYIWIWFEFLTSLVERRIKIYGGNWRFEV